MKKKLIKTILVVMGMLAVPLLILFIGGFLIMVLLSALSGSNNDDNGSSSSYTVRKTKVDIRPGITRKEIVDIALTLDGKIKYFWGGRSEPGWNDTWGTPKIVTAPGDWTSGTYQPYGLDCSGYIDWVYKTAGTTAMYGTTANQLVNSYAIDEKDLKPGDLVFRFDREGSDVNHVGIFYKKENGVKYYIHCQGGTGVIVNSTPTFQYWRRPYIKFEDD